MPPRKSCIGLIDPHAWKIPAREGGIPLFGEPSRLIFTLNQDTSYLRLSPHSIKSEVWSRLNRLPTNSPFTVIVRKLTADRCSCTATAISSFTEAMRTSPLIETLSPIDADRNGDHTVIRALRQSGPRSFRKHPEILLSTHLPHLLDEREAQAASVRLTQSKALRTDVASPVSTNPVSRKAMLIPSGREVSKSTPRTSGTGKVLRNWTRMRRRQKFFARPGDSGRPCQDGNRWRGPIREDHD